MVKKPKENEVESNSEHDQISSRQGAPLGTLNDAIAIAAIAHKGQFDKAGDPYILHPLRMMMRMVDADARIVAILHDVVEDSSDDDKWDSERLRSSGFSEKVIEAVDCVTKRNGESYGEFVDRAASNPISRAVKIADLEDNMNMLRLGDIRPKDLERLERYHRSWLKLKAGETMDGRKN